MITQKIRGRVSKNIYLKIILVIIIICVLAMYFKVFFTTGVYFDGTFLKKEVASNHINYIGRSKYGTIQITVKGIKDKDSSSDVIYRLPNNINRRYTVYFKNPNNWDSSFENIKDENGNIIFEGTYKKGDYFLFDKNKKPMMSDSIRITVGDSNIYNDDYKIPLVRTVRFALSENETIRGDYIYLSYAIILFIIVIIDIMFPLFFFTLKNLLTVKDPEPSDFYITMQKISWIVYPIIIVILMIAAIL